MINRGFSFEVIIQDKEKGLTVGNGNSKVENQGSLIVSAGLSGRNQWFTDMWSMYS